MISARPQRKATLPLRAFVSQLFKFVISASRIHRGATGCPQFPLARLSKLDARTRSGTDDEAECESAVSEIQLRNAVSRFNSVAELSLSIREVYRKLASALHPDRETDPQEREHKTALMQRANQAYSKNSLLQLLELQLELEHIDQSAINNFGEDRLKHYNKILKEQAGEIDHEILHIENGFKHSYGIPPFIDVSPSTIVRNLAADIFSLQESLHALEHDMLVFDDIKQLKDWLKIVKRSLAVPRFDDMPF